MIKQSSQEPGSGQEQRNEGLYISPDGYVRITLPELLVLPLVHFLSGLDDDSSLCMTEGGIQTSISGYTEWLSSGTPAITVGWDWLIDLKVDAPIYIRSSPPRTNIMLVNMVNHQDLGDEITASHLACLIDRSSWACATAEHIALRYAP